MVCAEEPDGGDGDGEPWPDDSGGDWGDANPGDDTGGGGSSNGGEDDGDDGLPCGDPMDGCSSKDPPDLFDPCDTNGEHPIIDSANIQAAIQILWQRTQDTEVEQGAFIYKNSSGNWSYTILLGAMVEYADYESIEFYIPNDLPDSTIFMHTHPDREILEKYGITSEYKNKPSEDDYDLIDEESKLIKGYILDEDMIIEHDGEEILDTISRCSY